MTVLFWFSRAVPVVNAQSLVLVRQLQVGVLRVPRLRERRRVVDPDVRDERLVVDLLPDLDGLDLLRVLGLRALVLAAAQRVRVDDELAAVPEADRVAVPERIAVGLGDVVAAVRVDAANVVDHLVDQIRLIGRHDEIAQERLRHPARMTRRRAIAQVVELDALLDVVELRDEPPLVLGRQLRRRHSIAALVLVPVEQDAAARVDAGPIRQARRIQALAAVRLRVECFIEVPRRAMLLAERDQRGLLRRKLDGGEARGGRQHAERGDGDSRRERVERKTTNIRRHGFPLERQREHTLNRAMVPCNPS